VGGWVIWQFGPPMSALGLQDIIKTVSIIICIEPTGLLRLRHIGKTDPQCGTSVQFCFRSGRLTCSARTGLRAVTTPLNQRRCQRGRAEGLAPLEKLPPWAIAWKGLLPILRIIIPCWNGRIGYSTRTTMKRTNFPGGLTNRI